MSPTSLSRFAEPFPRLEDGDGDGPWFGADDARGQVSQAVNRAMFAPSVVLITGPAGGGKTRLLRWAARLAAARGFAVHIGTSGPPTPTTASAWDEALAHWPTDSTTAGTRGDLGPASWPSAVMIDLGDAGALADMRAVMALRGLVATVWSQARPHLLVAAIDGPPSAVGAKLRTAGSVTLINLPPLSAADSRALLAWQPYRLDDEERDAVVSLAAGNPMALLELARALAEDDWPGCPARLAPGTRDLLGQRLAGLPRRTRWLLLGAAAAGRDGRLGAVLAAAEARLADFGPAERRHLVLVLHDRVAFADRLTRVAAYESATAGERRDMHHALAARAGGPEGARHRVRAAGLPGSPSHRVSVAGLAARPGRALAWGERGAGGIDPLTGLMGNPRISMHEIREILLDGVLAAVAGGHEADRLALGRLTQRVRQVAGRLPSEPESAWWLTLLTCAEVIAIGPGTAHDCAGAELFSVRGGPVSADELIACAVHTWRCGDEAVSTQVLRHVLAGNQPALMPRPHPVPTTLLLDGLIQCGLWVEAERRIADARSKPHPDVPGGRAAVDALAGLLGTVRHGSPPGEDQRPAGHGDGLAEAIRCLAQGRYATLHGDNAGAFAAYRRLFDGSGLPVHFALSPRGLPGLARTARTPEQLEDASTALRETRARAGGASAAGVTIVFDWAEALLDQSPSATARLPLIAGQLAELGRPYDQAVALVDHADRLRGARRVIGSQDSLRAADSLFGRLGARADRRAASDRLRATGVLGGPVPETGFASLTAQQQQIARLASSGLTNKDIGARLKLSPRTIGSHLYQIYPVLGVVGRRQLVDVLPLQP